MSLRWEGTGLEGDNDGEDEGGCPKLLAKYGACSGCAGRGGVVMSAAVP